MLLYFGIIFERDVPGEEDPTELSGAVSGASVRPPMHLSTGLGRHSNKSKGPRRDQKQGNISSHK